MQLQSHSDIWFRRFWSLAMCVSAHMCVRVYGALSDIQSLQSGICSLCCTTSCSRLVSLDLYFTYGLKSILKPNWSLTTFYPYSLVPPHVMTCDRFRIENALTCLLLSKENSAPCLSCSGLWWQSWVTVTSLCTSRIAEKGRRMWLSVTMSVWITESSGSFMVPLGQHSPI